MTKEATRERKSCDEEKTKTDKTNLKEHQLQVRSCNDIDHPMSINIEYHDSKSKGYKNATTDNELSFNQNFLNGDVDK